jgi:hypothetical protein
MVNSNSDGTFEKSDGLVTTSFRLPADLKRRVDDAAKANRRSFNAELLFRLMRSFDLDPTPVMPKSPLASETALLALSRTEVHAARLDSHEARLRKLERRK